MKMKATRKAIINKYDTRIMLPYCAMQDVLIHLNPLAYTSGIYGWNANIYHLDDDTCIVTGYRPFGNYKLPQSFIDYAVERISHLDNYTEREKTAQELASLICTLAHEGGLEQWKTRK